MLTATDGNVNISPSVNSYPTHIGASHMRITFEVDTLDLTQSQEYRTAASFFLHLAGDFLADVPVTDEEPKSNLEREVDAALAKGNIVPITLTPSDNGFPPAPPAPPRPPSETHDAEFPSPPRIPEPPVNFTTPPAASTAPMAASASPAAIAPAPIANATSAESGSDFDSSGLPWDGRIHQVKKGVKKDGTWKLQKGIDMALVSSVVAELSTKRLPSTVVATAPPAPPAQMEAFTAPPPPPAPPVSLPDTMPVPPPAPIVSGATAVPAPPVSTVPVPPQPAVGAVSATGFRELIQKISKGTKDNKLTPEIVSQIVQARGCPALQKLRDMAHLIPDIEADIDAVLLS